jgi:hypothetical protein
MRTLGATGTALLTSLLMLLACVVWAALQV